MIRTHQATGRVGEVVANYDVDNRRSGYGRGADDAFMPDIEKMDRLAAQSSLKGQLSRVGKSAWFWTSVSLGAAALGGWWSWRIWSRRSQSLSS